MDKIDAKGLALGIGILWGSCLMVAGWASPVWGSGLVQVFSTVYPGYSSGFVGGIIGGIWAFLDGAFAGLVIAWVHNWCQQPKKKRKK